MLSREAVLKNEKFIQIFSQYADVIGINKPQEVAAWTPIIKKREEIAIKKAEEEAKRLKAEAERIALEKMKQEEEERKKKANLVKDFFKILSQKGLNKYVGRPPSADKLKAIAA